MSYGEVLEIAVECDAEAAEAISELFNRFNGGGYLEDSEAGEASGGGAVIEATGFDDFGEPIEGEYRVVVRTYIKPGARGEEIRRQIEDGLWRLGLIYPIPEATLRTVREEDWANAWKQYYKPMRIGRRVVLKPTWEDYAPLPEDIVVELDPGMAFGTGLHPSTRLCIAALEELVRPGDAVLDVGTGSGVLSIVAAKLGATEIVATDIDPVAVQVAAENVQVNGLAGDSARARVEISLGSIPVGAAGRFQIVVANILAEVLANLLDGAYGNVPLAYPLAATGHLIMAGIIEEKAHLVIDAGTRHGLVLVDRKQESDWVALVMRPAPRQDVPAIG